tara:strand:+ start:414 stop:530 length:117 start_codon:yes stop_codon:yes gene_type:complete
MAKIAAIWKNLQAYFQFVARGVENAVFAASTWEGCGVA